MAIQSTQVDGISDTFTPPREQLARARTVIGAFNSNSGAGVLQIKGKMLDALTSR
jgi:citrate lyase beta subunit